ncbi:MAG: GGDEF domain-containing protein [Rhizobiales bacterium]|nr:GGDEF domain-containing protein [Hyphomicrobiales bacterium]
MMVDVPTLCIITVANGFGLALVWLFAIRAYPNLAAARTWMAAVLCGAAGAATVAMLREVIPPLPAILLGTGLLNFSLCLAWAGTRQFLGEKLPWRTCLVITGSVLVVLGLFTLWRDDIAIRIALFSAGQCIPLGLTIADLLSRRDGRRTPGMVLAAVAMSLALLANVLRAVLALAGVGGEVSFTTLNAPQSIALLTTLFGAMVWNFGFLLMSIDRLRNEIIHLAVVDDLTGIANRRRFIERLDEECRRSSRTGQSFALIAIDLDDFKGINDRHGHQAGDACLRHFAAGALSRLRGHDLLARIGGDEFCAILPAATPEAAEAVARSLVETVRNQRLDWEGQTLRATVSVGVAAWSKRVGYDSHLLLAQADEALYEAKRAGRDTFVAARRERPLEALDMRHSRAAATAA